MVSIGVLTQDADRFRLPLLQVKRLHDSEPSVGVDRGYTAHLPPLLYVVGCFSDRQAALGDVAHVSQLPHAVEGLQENDVSTINNGSSQRQPEVSGPVGKVRHCGHSSHHPGTKGRGSVDPQFTHFKQRDLQNLLRHRRRHDNNKQHQQQDEKTSSAPLSGHVGF